MIDWIALGTVGLVIVAIWTFVVQRIRTGDLDMIRALKADSDAKIEFIRERMDTLDRKIADVYTNVQAKLDKTDHQIALARIDKEISDLREDHKTGQKEIRQDIKDLRTDLMNAIRDANKQ